MPHKPHLYRLVLLQTAPLALITAGLVAPAPAQPDPPDPRYSIRNDLRLRYNAWPADFNRDSRTDLIAGSRPGLPEGPPTDLLVARGRGDGTFDNPRPLGITAIPFGTGDFNNDGRTDALIGDTHALSVLPGNGNMTFATPRAVPLPTGTFVSRARPYDLDGDGNRDVVVTTEDRLLILPGNGDLTFDPPVTLTISEAGSVVSGDFNGDGRRDLAAFSGCSELIVWTNVGGLLFNATSSLPDIGDCPADATVWDIDGDSALDLLVAASSGSISFPSAGHVAVLLGNGDGTFGVPATFDTGVRGEHTIVAGDFNRDGRVDVATGNWSVRLDSEIGADLWDSISILPGDGAGRLLPGVTYALDTQPLSAYELTHHSLNTADLNNDRQADLIASPGAILLNRAPAPNRPPSAWAGFDRTEASIFAWLLDGEGTDPDRHWLTYTWTDAAGAVIGDGPRVFMSAAVFGPGRHRFTLTVDDGQGGQDSDSVLINVPDSDNPIGAYILSPQTGDTLMRGTPVTIQWGATDGAFRRFDLWVSDSDGRSWGQIAGCTGLAGTVRACTWANPGPASDTARLRIVARDTSNVEWVSVTGQMRIR